MVETLLKTKCIIPALRQQTVPRLHLQDMTGQILNVPLAIISAPPGFGKTTSAITALQRLQPDHTATIAWLSLDEYDNDPARFWRYVGAAISTADAALGERLNTIFQSVQQFPIQSLLAELLNEIVSYPKHLLLVLDDYHVITQTAIHEELTFLLDHAPANLHLMLVTRADPSMPLHRLRARGQLLEVRAADLRFSQEEAAHLLNEMMALSLAEADIKILTAQTEGWVAGLQMAGLALQGDSASPALVNNRHAFIERLTRSNRYIIDYLAEEVLRQQSSEVQAFLLQTSILRRLCGPLCDAVTQRDNSESLLETLLRRNLFLLPAAGHSEVGMQWFRYHQLFADLLYAQLHQQEQPLIAELHRRAAVWYEQEGDIHAAIEHGLMAEDYRRVVRLLDTHAYTVTMEGQLLVMERWLKHLPAEWHHALPHANLAFGWALMMRGRLGEVEPYLQQADAAIAGDDTMLRGEYHALSATVFDSLGQADAALYHARIALEMVPADNIRMQAMVHMALAGALRVKGELDASIAAYEKTIPLCETIGLTFPALVSRAQLGYLLMIKGRLRQAEALARAVLDVPMQHPTGGAVLGVLGNVLIEQNRLDAAADYIHQAIKLAQRSGHNAALARSHVIQGRLYRAQGNLAEAQAALDAAAGRIAQGAPGWVETSLIAERVMLLLAQDLAGAAEQALLQHQAAAGDVMAHMDEVLPLAQAHIHYHLGRYQEALDLLHTLINSAEAKGRDFPLLEARVLRALVNDALHDEKSSRDDLQEALSLAATEGFVRVFLEAGPRIARLLAQMNTPYARKLLDAFPQAVQEQAAVSTELVEPLTERELEVLQLMAQGLTYQQVADALVVSINTVRHHVKGIYSKLGTETRTLALEKARLLNLI